MRIKHRGGQQTAEMYKNIPVHAAPGVHKTVVDLLKKRLPERARVADIGAGSGALSLRLHDEGFKVVAIDLSDADWMPDEVPCHVCNLDGDWGDVENLGPFDAVVAVEVIEHLENPRDFLRKLKKMSGNRKTYIVISTPNPLDTFSSITHFTRGIFNWFSPKHYPGGGHISILPYWLIDQHLNYLDMPAPYWSFHSPFRHRSVLGRIVYSGISLLRRVVQKGSGTDFHDGEAAILILELNKSNEEPS